MGENPAVTEVVDTSGAKTGVWLVQWSQNAEFFQSEADAQLFANMVAKVEEET